MICHGRSSAKAIKNAIRRAKGLAETRLDELIQRDIEESLRRHQDEATGRESRRDTSANHRNRVVCSGTGDDECRSGEVGRDVR